jgi:PAS domain S-box-containing protein
MTMRNRFADPQARLRLAMAAAKLGEWWAEGDGDVIHFSRRAGDIYGLGAELSLPRASVDVMIEPQDRAGTLELVAQAVEDHADFDVEYRVHRASDARVVWVHGRGHAVYDKAGQPLGLIGVVEDVTARRVQAEKERLSLQEAEHRARNVFMLIQALLEMTPYDSREAFVRSISGRISALALAHAVTIRADSRGVDLEELVRQELNAYAAPGRCAVQGPPVRLGGPAAQALAMVLHELATNAVKHGALKGRSGRLEVSWRLVDNGALAIEWRETSGRLAGAADAPGSGFGSVLLKQLSQQLGGALRRELGAGGMKAELTIAPAHVRPAAFQTAVAETSDLFEAPSERAPSSSGRGRPRPDRAPDPPVA